MQNMIENLINGNLQAAKNQAKQHTGNQIKKYLIDNLGYTTDHALAVSMYLKGIITFQRLCDLEEKIKNK